MHPEFTAPGHYIRKAMPSEDELILEARMLLAARHGWTARVNRALDCLMRGIVPLQRAQTLFDQPLRSTLSFKFQVMQ